MSFFLVCWVFTLVGALPGSGGAADVRSTALAAQPAPALRELKNATYSGFDVVKTPITLVDGRWEGTPYVAGGAARPTVSFVRDLSLIVDLDGDGSEDAIVLLAEHAAGSGEYVYLAVVARRNGQLHNVGTVRLGDRVQIRDLHIDGRQIVADLVQAGAHDAACCPGELLARRWQLEPDGLREADAATKPGRLTLETLAGTEWVLRGWNLNDSAPAQPEVTLEFKDGKFVGTAGCNHYFAAAQPGAMAGDVAVGLSGTTRMACPEAQMAVEDRFLKHLAGIKKFGFMIGQLALSYETDGGWGVLLFDAREAPRSALPPR